jgi:two-component system response regulator AtoC
MNDIAGKVLVVDDDRAMCEVLEKGLKHYAYEVESVTVPEQAVELLGKEDFDVLLTDLNMKGLSGFDLCERALAIRPVLPVIVITAFGSLDTAIGAIRAGAYDFITKPFEIEVAELAVKRAVQYRRLHDDLKRLQQLANGSWDEGDGLVGTSESIKHLRDLIDRVRDSEVTVLITGESGTGKQLVARALHKRSKRACGPFVAVNCAALPEPLLESELFGHVRGAFTDAKSARTGLFVQANRGTLFLDEIGEIPIGIQAKLLRALQDRVVRPVGSDQEVSFDARIVAATNRDLLDAVDQGKFRQDLYFRLNVLEIEVPPLRSRGSDVLLLAQNFLRKAAMQANKPVTAISTDTAHKIVEYSWPGNVRELQNCIDRAVALARFDQITVDDLPERILDFRRSHVLVTAAQPGELVTMEEVEKRYITSVLDAVDGNRTTAAKILGLDRKTLYRKLERWGLVK